MYKHLSSNSTYADGDVSRCVSPLGRLAGDDEHRGASAGEKVVEAWPETDSTAAGGGGGDRAGEGGAG